MQRNLEEENMNMLLIGSVVLLLSCGVMIEHSDAATEREIAVFGGGCFWCMEPPFEEVEGVLEVTAGYCGGDEKNPSYAQVSGGFTSHFESVQVVFDPRRVSYAELLEVFWRQIDPTDGGGQFADRGKHYRTVIFYANETQRAIAEKSKTDLQKSGIFSAPIVTAILPLKPFYPAEEYHQDYYKKNVLHYNSYKLGSGRAGFLEKTWKAEKQKQQTGKPDQNELRSRLNSCQFDVTQKGDTEPPFHNEYWDNHREGIYVDIVSGEPLFSSQDKYDSGSGWPSFTKPLQSENLVEKADTSHGMTRVEVRSSTADSHLGHVFDDGPAPTGTRYCINSAALKFIPVADLEKEGYGRFLPMFTNRQENSSR